MKPRCFNTEKKSMDECNFVYCLIYIFLCTCRSAKQKFDGDLTLLYINPNSCCPERLIVTGWRQWTLILDLLMTRAPKSLCMISLLTPCLYMHLSVSATLKSLLTELLYIMGTLAYYTYTQICSYFTKCGQMFYEMIK